MQAKFYAADLAYIHDQGFLEFSRRAAPASGSSRSAGGTWSLKR